MYGAAPPHVTPRLRSCTVYLGSRFGANEAYADAAERLGRALAHRRIHVVFGGGSVGCMGALARSALGAGGEVTGIIPGFLASCRESDLTALEVVDTMAERKAQLYNKGECIMVLPGGIGTLEEAFEVLGWITQAPPEKRKPIGFLSVGGFYEPLLEMLRSAVHCGFMQEGALGGVFMNDRPELLIDTMLRHAENQQLQQAPEVEPPAAPPSLDSSADADETQTAAQAGAASAKGCVVFGETNVLGRGEDHASSGARFGECLAKHGKAILCDGGNCGGVVGATLRGALVAGGRLVRLLHKELDASGFSNMVFETITVSPGGAVSPHLVQSGDWFAGLSGGVKVWGEVFEVLSLVQLGRLDVKPLGLLSVQGYYRPLQRQLRMCVDSGFLQEEFLTYLVYGDSAEDLVEKLQNYSPSTVVKTRDERPDTKEAQRESAPAAEEQQAEAPA